MSYSEALSAAGAEVVVFQMFGDYQGSWWAKVIYGDRPLWVTGSYGSCSGCDAFQADFGYSDPACDDHQYESVNLTCESCKVARDAYNERFADFGRQYLDNNHYTQDEAETYLAKQVADYDWGSEYSESLAFVQANK